MNPGRTEPLRSSPLRTRPVFPPAPAIPISTTRVGSRSVPVHAHESESAGETESSTNSQPEDRQTNDAESILYSASSSLSQQYSPIEDPSRHVSYAPSVREPIRTSHPGDDILIKYVSLYEKG